VSPANKNTAIFDIDGTLVDSAEHFHLLDSTPLGHTKNLYEYHSLALNSPPRESVVALSRVLWEAGIRIVIVTSRYNNFLYETVEWLKAHNIYYDELYMRDATDDRTHYLVKKDILNVLKSKGYNILLAVDDNPEIIKLWQEHDIVAAHMPV